MNNSIKALIILAFLFTVRSESNGQVSPSSNLPDNTSQPTPPTVTSFPNLYDYNTNNIQVRSFVREYIPQVATQTSSNIDLGSLNANSTQVPSLVTTAYFDGLGRKMQEVVRAGNTQNGKDLIMVHGYDALGRESSRYLPYCFFDGFSNRGKLKSAPLTQLSSTYNTLYPGQHPYRSVQYDNSPLNRTGKVMREGEKWVGSNTGATYDYNTNQNNFEDQVLNYSIGYQGIDFNSGSFGDLPVATGNYNAGELVKTKKTDEDGNYYYVYTDKFGRTIAVQKKVSYTGSQQYWNRQYNISYNVYDGMGNLRFVITPEAYRQAAQAGTAITQQIADGLCYQYVYDNMNRQVAKKLPGKSAEYMVYDNDGRLTYYQDGNLRAANRWYFIYYDGLNRPVKTGVYNNNISQPSLTASLLNNGTTLSNCDIMAEYYYDNYNYAGAGGFTTAYNAALTGQLPYAQTPTPTNRTRGLLTGTRAKVMYASGPVQWLVTSAFYDDKGRLIQQQSENIRGGQDITTNQYDFAGSLISSVTDHTNPQANAYNGIDYTQEQIVKRYTKNYQNGVITKMEQNINGTGWHSIHTLGFDDLNRVSSKNMPAADNLYNYDIHGWLTGINSGYIDASAPANKYFFETLSYNNGFARKLYNGSIAGITWKGAGGAAPKRCYGYTYDELNRLQHAEFAQWTTSASVPQGYWDKTVTDLTAAGMAYDYNGNLLTMNQRGPGASGPVDMDKLTYTYAPASNKLTSVTESNGITTTGPDFKDGNTSGNDYDYDFNGNLKYDKNKNINSDIVYNYFDKPTHVVVDGKGTIDYLYDGLGNLLRKVVTGLGSNAVTTDYIGPFVYVDNNLKYVLHEEGRCRPQLNNTAVAVPAFDYDYFLKDHLGNVRTVVNARAAGVGPQLSYNAGMEVSLANTESLVWSHLDDVRADKPGGTSSDTKAAELNGAEYNKRIGVALLLKAMPGDRFDLSAQTWYDAIGDNNVANAADITGSLLATLTGGANYDGVPVNELPENIRVIENTINTPGFIGAYDALTSENYDSTRPAAFLNYVVFDENFRVVKENSGALQAGGSGAQWNLLATNGQVTISQPGYIAVFASSRVGSPVFFDHVDMTYYRGTVLEENHYYPFGLTLSNGSTVPDERNSYKLTTKELQDDFDLNWYDFGARMHDEQTGRWLQADPLAEYAPAWTPYRYGFDNPVSFVDPDGMQEAGGQSMTQTVHGLQGPTISAPRAGPWVYWEPKTFVPGIGDVQLPYAHGGGNASNVSEYQVSRIPNKYAGIEEYRAYQEYPFEIPGESLWDRMFRHMGANHREIMLDFGGGGYNMFGGYGRVAQALDAGAIAARVVEGGTEVAETSGSSFNPTAFADEIVGINRATEGGGVTLNGNPSTAVNSAMYYETAAEQGASIFRSISHGHMFVNGNKRTAVAALELFARQNGLTTVGEAQLFDVAIKVAEGKIQNVLQIAKMLFK